MDPHRACVWSMFVSWGKGDFRIPDCIDADRQRLQGSGTEWFLPPIEVARGHGSAVDALQRQYFDWNVVGAVWDAHWRVAPDRVMPGTAAGSAPQESWHQHSLKARLGHHYASPHALAADLSSKVVMPALRDLKRVEQLPDWPGVRTIVSVRGLSKVDPLCLKRQGNIIVGCSQWSRPVCHCSQCDSYI